MTVRQSGVVEKELTARSKSEFLDESGSSSTSVATVVRLPLARVRKRDYVIELREKWNKIR